MQNQNQSRLEGSGPTPCPFLFSCCTRRVVKDCIPGLLLLVMVTLGAANLASAQESRKADCPQITVACPNQIDGRSVFFTATVAGVPNARYVWSLSSGTITQGQGTTSIRVAVGGDSSITATIEVIGLPAQCGNMASCTIIGHRGLPKARKFDQYSLTCTAKSASPGKSKRSKIRSTPK